MKVCLFVSLLIIFSLFSCTGKKDISVITFQLNKSDYIEKIYATGTVQAVVNTPVMPPRSQMGMMTVVQIVQDGEYVKKGDTLCVLSSPEVQSRYSEMLTSIESLEAELKGAEADIHLNIAILEATLAISEAQLKISSLDSLQMEYATEVKQRLLALEMKKATIEKQKTEKKLAATKMIGETDIRQKKAMIVQEKMRAQTFADQISAMTIIAQRDGIVLRCEGPRLMVSGSAGTGSFGGPIREGSVIIIPVPILQFPDLSTDVRRRRSSRGLPRGRPRLTDRRAAGCARPARRPLRGISQPYCCVNRPNRQPGGPQETPIVRPVPDSALAVRDLVVRYGAARRGVGAEPHRSCRAGHGAGRPERRGQVDDRRGVRRTASGRRPGTCRSSGSRSGRAPRRDCAAGSASCSRTAASTRPPGRSSC